MHRPISQSTASGLLSITFNEVLKRDFPIFSPSCTWSPGRPHLPLPALPLRTLLVVKAVPKISHQSGSIVIVNAWRQDPSSIKQVVVVVQVHALLAVDRLVNSLSVAVLARRGAHVGEVALGLEEPGLLDPGRRRDGCGEPEQVRAAALAERAGVGDAAGEGGKTLLTSCRSL